VELCNHHEATALKGLIHERSFVMTGSIMFLVSRSFRSCEDKYRIFVPSLGMNTCILVHCE
jgi:hypothetical protein